MSLTADCSAAPSVVTLGEPVQYGKLPLLNVHPDGGPVTQVPGNVSSKLKAASPSPSLTKTCGRAGALALEQR
jgi:hypothetical protein